MDTGAQVTCISAKDLGIKITEQEFRNKYTTVELEGHGIIDSDKKDHKVTYYLIQVENFEIEGIGLGSVPIYITFDSRAKKRLLGLDLLSLLNIELDFDTRRIRLSKTESLKNFFNSNKKLRLEINDMFDLGIYSKDDYITDVDIQNIIQLEQRDS